TSTTPCRAKDSPSKTAASVPSLAKLPPPGIQTITALRDVDGQSAIQTFKYRQSSLDNSAALGAMNVGFCAHIGPNFVVSRTPGQGVTGCGSRHRRSPTGGAANGIPLNTAPPLLS